MSNIIDAEIVEENKSVVLSEIKYPVSNNGINIIINEYKDIPEINPNSEDTELIAKQFDFVLKGHKRLVKLRNQIEKTRKFLKEPALSYGKTVDTIAKEFQAMIKPTEDKLFIQRKLVEDNETRKQAEAEALEAERVSNIKTKMEKIRNLPLELINGNSNDYTIALESLRGISKEEYEEYFEDAHKLQEDTISILQRARENQVVVENAKEIQAKAEAEVQALRDEAYEKAKSERDALQKEKDDFIEEQRLFREQQRLLQEETDMKLAEAEADALVKKQKEDNLLKLENDIKLINDLYTETLDKFEAYDDVKHLLDSIIDGKEFPHIKWGV